MRETMPVRRPIPIALPAGAATCLVATSLAPARASAQPAPADWRSRLLASARAATFEAEQDPVADETARGGAPTGLPKMTFAPAPRTRGGVGIAGRITSSADYAPLGIARGVNYLWVDTRTPVRMAIVPADSARSAHWLAVAPHTSSSASSPCRMSPFATQLGFGRPSGGSSTLMTMAACTCVNGVWMHGGRADEMLSRETAARLIQP